MVDKIDKDMALDREAKMAVIAGDLMYDIIDDLDRKVDIRISQEINESKYNAERSAVAWGEKMAYMNIKKRLRQKVKLGVGARERLAPHMNIVGG
jgi:hypothetical protein